MSSSVKLLVSVSLLIAATVAARADGLQPGTPPGPQMSAVPKMEPKPSGGANTESTHFVKPPGYDHDRSNYPYGLKTGPKPS
jgi:hypothetical protein